MNTSNEITAEEMKAKLRLAVEDLGSGSALAAQIGVSDTFLYLILQGKSPIPDSVANYFGYAKVKLEPVYRKQEQEQKR